MVAMNDGQDHGDGEACAGCRFVEALVQHLDAAVNGDDQRWHDATGEITDKLHSALWALHRMRSEAATDYSDEIDNHGEAARAIAALGAEIDQLWHTLMDDVSQGHDPNAGT